MRTAFERDFIRRGRRGEALLADDTVSLVPREYNACVHSFGGARSLVFDIVDLQSGRVSGEIALRAGESDSLFYLGHVGYHVDPPYRGRHEALHACRLCEEAFRALGMRSFVITTDTDNLPSIRTCELLGCALESTVVVPGWCRGAFSISDVKRRYVRELPPRGTPGA